MTHFNEQPSEQAEQAEQAADGPADGSTSEQPQAPRHQARRRLLELAGQMDRIEAQLDRLFEEAQAGGAQVDALTRHLTGPEATRPLDERLADLLERLEAGQDRLEELGRSVTRMSREQFKANALFEGKEEQVKKALATLQEIATRRDEQQQQRRAEQQQRRAARQAEARAALAADLLPVLDGLERALEHGRTLRERMEHPAAGREKGEKGEKGFWQTVRTAFTGRAAPEPAPSPAPDALDAWLEGLELVRERFLQVLAAESIRPIDAQGRPFDPRLHVAVGTRTPAGAEPDTVAEVVRRGYRRQDQVLRYAEVIVARNP